MSAKVRRNSKDCLDERLKVYGLPFPVFCLGFNQKHSNPRPADHQPKTVNRKQS